MSWALGFEPWALGLGAWALGLGSWALGPGSGVKRKKNVGTGPPPNATYHSEAFMDAAEFMRFSQAKCARSSGPRDTTRTRIKIFEGDLSSDFGEGGEDEEAQNICYWVLFLIVLSFF